MQQECTLHATYKQLHALLFISDDYGSRLRGKRWLHAYSAFAHGRLRYTLTTESIIYAREKASAVQSHFVGECVLKHAERTWFDEPSASIPYSGPLRHSLQPSRDCPRCAPERGY